MADRNPMNEARPPLSRERILIAAVGLADEGGIEALSMRKLAAALGVEAMSLYNHVANKDDLIDGILDLVVGEIQLPPDGEPWDAAIRQGAASAHRVLMRHPWACSLVITHTSPRPGPSARLRYIEWLLGRLRDAGLSAELTYHAYHAINSHILGYTFWELGHSMAANSLGGGEDFAVAAQRFLQSLPAHEFEHLIEHARQHFQEPWPDTIDGFEFGLELILDGLKRHRPDGPGLT